MCLLEVAKEQSRSLSDSLGSIKLRVQIGHEREGMINEMCQELCRSKMSSTFIVGSSLTDRLPCFNVVSSKICGHQFSGLDRLLQVARTSLVSTSESRIAIDAHYMKTFSSKILQQTIDKNIRHDRKRVFRGILPFSSGQKQEMSVLSIISDWRRKSSV